MTIYTIKSRGARSGLLALFLATLGAGLFLYARAPYVIDLPSAPDRPIEAEAERYHCLALDCRQPLPSELDVLGNPAAWRYPDCHQAQARTPWDLLAHEGRLYIGLGDDSNDGPSPNAGPVPILAYEPASGRFVQESVLPEEQVDRFYHQAGELWTPGADPRQSWRWGNVYRRDGSGGWRKFRTLPRTIHTHALAWRRGQLFAGVTASDVVPATVGRERWGSAVARSGNGGEDWELQPLGGWRILDFLTVEDRLYALDAFPGPGLQQWLDREQRQDYHAPVYQYVDESARFERRPDLDAQAMFPESGLAGRRTALPERAVAWGQSAAYLGVFARQRDEPRVRGAYIASDLEPGRVRVTRIPLPASALAFDLREEQGELQVLFAEPGPDQTWRNQVWTTSDGQHWRSLVDFTAAAPARSFERMNGDWYFGLGQMMEPASDGCEPKDAVAGVLLRWHNR